MTVETTSPFDLLQSAGKGEAPTSLNRLLEAMRSHLGMQVAYVSEFIGDRTYFRAVDAPGLEDRIKPGDSMALDDVYCRHILEGRLPELIPDTSAIPFAADIPLTTAMGIRAHVSVPLKLTDGRTYGMFCCISTQPEPSLNPRDLKMMRAVAELAALQISNDLAATAEQRALEVQVQRVLQGDELSIVCQPIISIANERIAGFECLSRFSGPENHGPDVWFNMAEKAGLGRELELHAIEKGLEVLPLLPSSMFLTLNVAPATIPEPRLAELLETVDASRLVLEITEHSTVEDYQQLTVALARFRAMGVRLAVDDAGAGYASLRHILALHPDIIKLDISLTRDVHLDPARNALASALVHFARQTGCEILAEGVEEELELAALRRLGIDSVQGYLLGRPMQIGDAVAAAIRQEAKARGRTATAAARIPMPKSA